jgi:hypothetical protein
MARPGGGYRGEMTVSASISDENIARKCAQVTMSRTSSMVRKIATPVSSRMLRTKADEILDMIADGPRDTGDQQTRR